MQQTLHYLIENNDEVGTEFMARLRRDVNKTPYPPKFSFLLLSNLVKSPIFVCFVESDFMSIICTVIKNT